MSFQYTIGSRNGVGIARLQGRLLEKYEAAALIDEVKEKIAGGILNFVIDLRKLEYLNSNGLNVLINMLTISRNAGGDAIICNVSPKLKNLFVITRLDTVFQMTGNQAAALQILEKSEKNNGA
jgi:anti-anti-sigma factor